MKVIHKYNDGTVEMPKGAKVLHVGGQHGKVRIWAEVDPDAEIEGRRFVSIPTGGIVPEDGEYLGTVILYNEQIVYHVYETGGTDERR